MKSEFERCARKKGYVTNEDINRENKDAIEAEFLNRVMFFAGDASARRSIDLIKLDVMPTEETKEVFVKGFDEANIKWEDKDLDDNILATGGYPHSIQLLGHNLLQVDKDDYIDKDDWHQATGITALDLRSKDFAPMYNFEGRSGGREKILDVLAVVNRSLSKFTSLVT